MDPHPNDPVGADSPAEQAHYEARRNHEALAIAAENHKGLLLAQVGNNPTAIAKSLSAIDASNRTMALSMRRGSSSQLIGRFPLLPRPILPPRPRTMPLATKRPRRGTVKRRKRSRRTASTIHSMTAPCPIRGGSRRGMFSKNAMDDPDPLDAPGPFDE